MSIYDGTRIEQEYAHGRDEGYADAEANLSAGRGADLSLLERTWHDLRMGWSSRETRAWTLGWIRGYREAVRTIRDGKWGT